MKNIKKFLLVIVILLVGLMTYNESLAYTPSFSNLQITNLYDTHAQALKLTFVLNNVESTPSGDYYIKAIINGKSYSSDLNYNSSISKMYSFMTISIPKSELRNYYYINYYVVNNSGNIHQYSKLNYKLLLSDASGLNWAKAKVINTYDSSYKKLKLTLSLANITSDPNIDHYMKLKFNNKYYTSDIIYDSAGKKLYAFFSIDINKADLKNYYYITYSIINNNENTLVYSKSNLKIDIINKENISWSSMTTSNSYDKDNEYLELNFNLNNIKTKPLSTYYIKLNFGNSSNSTYTSDLIYDPANDKLNTSFLIDINRTNLKNYYYVSYTVYDADNLQVYTKTNHQVTVSNYTYYNNTNCSNNNAGYYYNNTYYTCNNTSYYNTDCSNNNAGYYHNNTYYTCSNYNTYYSNDNINWSNSKITNTFNNYNKEVNLDFYITNVYNQPQNDYYVKIYVNGNYYTAYFAYESYNNQLHTNINFYLDSSYTNTSYYMSYNYMDSSNSIKNSGTSTIYINNTSSNYYNKDFYNYAWDKINAIESTYYNNIDRKYYINQEINYIINNTTYDSNFKSDVINIFNTRLNNY